MVVLNRENASRRDEIGTMLKIGICDMDAEFVQNLQIMLEEALSQYTDWEVQVYLDSTEVIAEIEAGTFSCHLLFLDIFQKKDTGITIAGMVEQYHTDTDIIFITASRQYVFECYRSHTFAYLLKPLKETDISTEVSRYLKERDVNPKCLNISNRGVVTKIPLETIVYIESDHRKVIVHTLKRDYVYYEKLDRLEEMLKQDGFLRCHQSYLVAVDKISAYQSHTLQAGIHGIPVSRKYWNNVLQYVKEKEITASNVSILKDSNQAVAPAQQFLEQTDSAFLTSGVFQYQDEKGALVCVKGVYIGRIVRVVPEQTIVIGRDHRQADLVIDLPMVSRKHCTIVYHKSSNDYEITDHSSNGTFVDGSYCLERGDTYRLRPGTALSFGDKSLVYRLG